MIVFNIRPVPKPRMTRRDRWAQRPIVMKWFNFKDNLNKLADKYNYKVPPVLKIDFFVQVPTSWSQKKKDKMIGQPHQQKGRNDNDNLQKAFLDSLCEDDSYVWNIHARKFWSDKDQIIVY